MIARKESWGYAWTWLFEMHEIDLWRYIETYYYPEDYDVVYNFFYQNPIQGKKIVEDFNKRNDQKLMEVVKAFAYGKSKIVYIIGARDSGKTCTAFKIADEVNLMVKKKIYYIGDGVNIKALPEWCGHLQDIQIAPNGAFGIIDEAAVQFNARDFQKEENKNLGKLLAIARHKDMFLIFITQHSGLADVNITRLRDMALWKQSNDYGMSERGSRQSKEHQFWLKAKNMMAPRRKEECLFEYPAQRRLIHFSHGLPRGWSENLSKIWGDKDFNKQEKEVKPIAKKVQVLRV